MIKYTPSYHVAFRYFIALGAVALLSACATNPRTGEWEFRKPSVGVSAPQSIREMQGQTESSISPASGSGVGDDSSCSELQAARNEC